MTEEQPKRAATPPLSEIGFIPQLGLQVVERGEGRSVCRLELRAGHMNPHGVVHGAVPYAMADTGMGAAVYSVMEEGESCATIEVKIVYLAPIRDGVLECETRALQKGRTVVVLESDIRNGERVVARALGTFSVFPIRKDSRSE